MNYGRDCGGRRREDGEALHELLIIGVDLILRLVQDPPAGSGHPALYEGKENSLSIDRAKTVFGVVVWFYACKFIRT